MSFFSILLILFVVAIILVLIIFFIYLKIKLKIPEEGEGDIIINLASNKSDKRCIGLIKKIIPGCDNREVIIYTPKIIGRDEVEVEEENRVIVDKKIILPRGSLESGRGIQIVLPHNSEDMPNEIKKDLFGYNLSNHIESKNVEKNIITALREARERQDNLRINQGGGELSNKEIRRMKDIVNKLEEMRVKSGDKEGGYVSTPR